MCVCVCECVYVWDVCTYGCALVFDTPSHGKPRGKKICKNMQYKYSKAVVSTLVIPAMRTKHEGASHKRGFRPHGSQDLAEQSGSM